MFVVLLKRVFSQFETVPILPVFSGSLGGLMIMLFDGRHDKNMSKKKEKNAI